MAEPHDAPPATMPAAVPAVPSVHATDAALAESFDRHLSGIYGFIARRITDRTVAEELTAMTFERARDVLRRDGFGEGSIGGFLYQVASSAVADHARRTTRALPGRARASDFDRDGDREAAEALVDAVAMRVFAATVDRDHLRRGLLRLSGENRRLVLLRYFDGLEPEELGAALGRPNDRLGVEAHRALRALHGAVDQEASGAA